MELRYSTNSADYLALLKYHLDKSILGQRFSRFAWIAIASLAWLSVLLPYLKYGAIDLGFGARAIVATMVTVGFPFFYQWYNNSVLRQIVNENSVRGIAGLTDLVVTSDFIEQRTATTTARGLWRDVSDIASTEHHDFVSLAPLVTIVIPASSFTSAQARREFRAQLVQWRDAAQCHASGAAQ